MVVQASAVLKDTLYRDGKFSRKNKTRTSATIKRCNSIESIRSIQHEQTKLKALFQTFFQRRKKVKETLPKERSSSESDQHRVIAKKNIERSSSEGEKLNMLIERELIENKLEKFNISEIKTETKRSEIIKTKLIKNSEKAYDSESSVSSKSFSKDLEREKYLTEYNKLRSEIALTEKDLQNTELEIQKLENELDKESQTEYGEILRDEYFVSAEIESKKLLMKSVRKLTIEQKQQMAQNLKLIENLELHIRRRKLYVEKMKQSIDRTDEMPRVMRRQISIQNNIVI